MGAFKFVSMFFLFTPSLSLILCSFFCRADMNKNCSQQCSKSDSFSGESDFKANLKSLLESLAENGPVHNGFYSTSKGESSTQIFGLVQCRGDISANNCGSCIKNSSVFALSECPESRDVVIWFRWCFLRYSTDNFLGILDQTSVAVLNDTNYDDPSLVSDGQSLMSGLASSVPYQSLMFQIAVLEGGVRGKRYGMAQCTRDISGSDCGLCLNAQLDAFRTTIGSKKDWEVWKNNLELFWSVDDGSDDSLAAESWHRICKFEEFSTWLCFYLVFLDCNSYLYLTCKAN
ncbi:cysteine-rich repeat secretory protein 38-like isoform X2 [Cucurbita maxima]|uniref:Cysteine-rich repeat secretory protein 38-like isoform X2 n=1 Tax=Cucurbita maxima TaxID=3661 RepID=A0A6J1JW49_CUCMA|nr:cysteine-rich repeat secretory protein 38-like isoform X2 [Cucurbita maxima]